jgi:glucosamine 6-phosphate synthetase-like amidotransferase/phosphosugar isomerase protein
LCGISGAFSKEQIVFDNEILSCLHELIEERGKDSSGIVAENGKCFVTLATATKMVNMPEYSFLLQQPHNLIMQHTRQKTHGHINLSNAQPFVSERFLLVHNGIVFNANSFLKNKDNKVSDSKKLFDYLSETKDIKKIVSDSEGILTIAAYDKEAKKLYFYTNKNALTIALDKNKNVFYFASEKKFLETAILSDSIYRKHFGLTFRENLSLAFCFVPDQTLVTYDFQTGIFSKEKVLSKKTDYAFDELGWVLKAFNGVVL